MGSIKSINAFYSDCIADYHAEAAKMGVATKGIIFIPELIPYGEKILLTFLQDPIIEMEFSDPRTYYYAIMSFGIQSGIVFAAKWHEDFSGACCNGDSGYRVDFTGSDFVCDRWERRK